MSMCPRQMSMREGFADLSPSWKYSRRRRSASVLAPLALHELRDCRGEFGGLFERHHMRAACDQIDLRVGNSLLEFVGINRGQQLVVHAPYDQGRRRDSMQPFAQSLVGNRPHELAGASERPCDSDEALLILGIQGDPLERRMMQILEQQ